MSHQLEITELENGDVVLREASASDSDEPLLRISFSDDLRDMLGGDLVSVAEAMIDAATDYLIVEPDLGSDIGPDLGFGAEPGAALVVDRGLFADSAPLADPEMPALRPTPLDDTPTIH